MKKFFTFLLPFSLLASAALSSCSDGCTGEPDPTPELPDGYTYATENTSINDGTVTANMLFFGTSTVTTVASGATFTDGKALFELVADSKYLTITFTCAGAFDVNYQGRLIIEK